MTRLAGKYVVDDGSGCWVWQRARNGNGYGKLTISGRQQYAHRVAYEEKRGAIPPGFTIDHLCRNRACCNPDHLEAVTFRNNVRRIPRVAAKACARGHELNAATLHIRADGVRYCSICVGGPHA